MNVKQFALLLFVALIVGVIGLVVYQRRADSWQSAGQSIGGKLFENFPANDVAGLTIKDAKAELNLVKQGDLWRVRERSDYPADFSAISEFLRQVIDLKFVQRETVGPSMLPRLELVAPGEGGASGTRVEFRNKDGQPIASLLLGKKHMRRSAQPSPFGGDDEGWPDGRFVMVGKDLNKVGLISNPLSNLEPKPEQWLNKDFFKVENIRSVAVTTGEATNDWAVARESASAEFKLTGAKESEKLDSNKIIGLPNLLSSPSFNDVLAPDAKPDVTGLDHPVTAKIETFDGLAYTVRLGKPSGENDLHLQMAVSADLPKERTPGKDEKPEDKEKLDKEFAENNKKTAERLQQEKAYEKWVYVVSKWTVDQLQKKRHELLEEKKEEPKKDPATPGAASPQ